MIIHIHGHREEIRWNRLCSIIKIKSWRFIIKQKFLFVDITWKIKSNTDDKNTQNSSFENSRTSKQNATLTYEAVATAFFLGVAWVPDNNSSISHYYILSHKESFHFEHITPYGKHRVPSLKPVLNLRGTWRRYLMRPVPVVFLLIALTLQLSKAKSPNQNQTSWYCQ